jgi:small redox-active disulfide protein 2
MTMNIKVLGTGCARCNSLEKTVKEVVKELGLNIEIEHVTDMKQIMQYSILMMPGLVIDEKVVSSGSIPGKDEVKKMISLALKDEKGS